jgi:hypothetical protein
VSPQERVDRHENTACGSGAEQGSNGLDPLVEVYSDPFLTRETEPRKAGGGPGNLLPQFAVAHGTVLVHERRDVPPLLGHGLDELMDEYLHRQGADLPMLGLVSIWHPPRP